MCPGIRGNSIQSGWEFAKGPGIMHERIADGSWPTGANGGRNGGPNVDHWTSKSGKTFGAERQSGYHAIAGIDCENRKRGSLHSDAKIHWRIHGASDSDCCWSCTKIGKKSCTYGLRGAKETWKNEKEFLFQDKNKIETLNLKWKQNCLLGL